jgi:acetyltransferase-like isoleucine patch superfamily enzyme
MLVAHAGIEVGAGAVIGDEAVIVDFAPRYDDVERPVRQQGIVAEPVHIGAGARIGARAAVQRGVVIGERAEVGPLSVVTRDAAPGARVGGVPAQAPAPLRPPRPTGRGTRGGSRSPRDL